MGEALGLTFSQSEMLGDTFFASIRSQLAE